MRRGAPLRRLTPLRRSTPLRSVGSKATREAAALNAARAEVRLRVGCEAAGMEVRIGVMPCGRAGPHRGAHAHHVWPEDRDRSHHDPARMLWLCADAHRWVHDNPADAARLGLLRPTYTAQER